MKIIKEFKGYSGCRIYLCEDNGNYFVRKYSRDLAYNSRLEKQMNKQKSFYDNHNIGVPRIIRKGNENGVLFFDMDYINGKNAMIYFHESNLDEIKEVLDKIFIAINNLKEEKIENNDYIYETSLEKFKEVLEKVNLEPKLIKEMIEKLEILKKVKFPSTLCHGDMTFDNILVDRDKNIFFIDLLDIYYNSHWFDIALLYQNVENDYYRHFYPGMILSPEKKELIMEKLNSFCKKNDMDYLKVHNVLLMLKFLRMLPYAKNQDHFQNILNQINCYKDAQS